MSKQTLFLFIDSRLFLTLSDMKYSRLDRLSHSGLITVFQFELSYCSIQILPNISLKVCVFFSQTTWNSVFAILAASLIIWICGVLLLRYSLKLLLSYHGFMFEPHGKVSLITKIWVVSVIYS